MQDVADMIATIEGVEIHAAEAGKIVVVIEGCSSGALGERLAEISALDGVLAANMVFEHMETRGDDRP
nr:chaperone NapD [Rhizobium sp. 18065]